MRTGRSGMLVESRRLLRLNWLRALSYYGFTRLGEATFEKSCRLVGPDLNGS
jgi:hypothetical protein